MKRKYTTLAIVTTLILVVVAFAGMNDRFSDIQLEEDNYILFPEISTAPATPDSGYGKVSVRSGNIYFLDDEGTETSMIAAAAGGVADLDEAYDGGGAGAGAEIAVDSGPVILTGTHATTNTLNLTGSGTGHLLTFSNTGSGNDISGTAGWNIDGAGAATFASIGAFTGTGNIDLDDGSGASPSFTFTDEQNETAVFSKVDDGRLTLTTLAADGLNVLTGNLWVGNGSPGTASMDGEDAYIEGELEVDGAAEFDGAVNIDGAVTMTSTLGVDGIITLENGLTIDNAVNNTLEWNENSEEIKWTFGSNILEMVSTTGVVELSLFDNAADVKLSHAADGAGDDFYIDQTGAQDASLILRSAGTGADALQVTATAGGIDITSAATFDIDLTATGGRILGVASEAAADQFKIDAQGTVAGDAINLETTDGGIMLNADGAENGDIELNAADDLVLTSAGATTMTSGDWGISATGAATGMASIGFDSGSVLYQDTVTLSNADIKALRATPKELIAAPAAGSFIEVVSAYLILDYGSDVLTETDDNLVIEYGTSNDDITAAIEMTDFIDQAADTIMAVQPANPLAANAATDMVANSVELFNTGDGEFGGNSSDDTTMIVKITYRVHTSGL